MTTIREFNDIPVSTRTFTATSNVIIDMKAFFDLIEITPYTVIPKKRGRRKKTNIDDPNKDIPYGSIITAKFESHIKGVDMKANKPTKKWFRNSITLVMVCDKILNFKVCKNGTLQMTGCKTVEHAKLCVKRLWGLIKQNPSIYNMKGDKFTTLIIPSMRNIDFSIDYLVDREKLNSYMVSSIQSHCLLETSFGYTGVNIKFPVTTDINQIEIYKLEGDHTSVWEDTLSTYSEFAELVSKTQVQQNRKKRTRYNTFLVFHSGKVIMSGMSPEVMVGTYYIFRDIMTRARPEVEEKLIL